MPRVVVPGLPHHVTQRGNNRQDVFFTDDDRRAYLTLLLGQSRRHGLAVRGYCLMSNHVHLVVVPEEPRSLARALAGVHLQFAQRMNRLHGRSGHLWQNRFYSCPLEPEHELMAVRYVERNPVRARLVRLPWRYPWSSAAAHCGEANPENPAGLLDRAVWSRRYTAAEWRRILLQPGEEALTTRLRRSTFNGRPLGGDRFIAKLEVRLRRRLRPLKIGRPRLASTIRPRSRAST
jgi:putative transposase